MEWADRARTALETQAPTARGQALGLGLILLPAVADALPLHGAARTTLLLVTVVAGFAGALLVFGGLLLLLFPPAPDAAPITAIPRTRSVLLPLTGLAVLLAAGALWCLALSVTDGPGEHLPEALMLGLPAVALGWAAWALGPRDEPTADEPAMDELV